eukprot:305932-Chlamydomonas_euryale.AAC.2
MKLSERLRLSAGAHDCGRGMLDGWAKKRGGAHAGRLYGQGDNALASQGWKSSHVRGGCMGRGWGLTP